MGYRPEDENQSTWKPLTREQMDELRRQPQPGVREVTEPYNDIGRKPHRPVTPTRDKSGPVYH